MNRATSSLFKRVTAAALGLTMVFGMSAAALPVLSEVGSIAVSAASSVSINATQVTLYGLNSWADEYISIPSSYATKFQLKVTGASSVTYSTNSSYLSVSDTGLITAKRVTKYTYSMGNGWAYTTTTPDPTKEPIRISQQMEFGTYTVTVRADGQTYNVSVTIQDYANTYTDKVMDDYLKANITSGMSTYDKLVKIAQFIADRNYSASYSSAVGLVVAGGADCWGSTDAAVKMAKKIGLQAWSRNGNRDAGSGSGHMNAMITDGKEYYELEAGYSGTAPRYYYIKKRTSLFSYRTVSGGVEVYQYDGQTMPEVLTVPATIDGKTVIGIGNKFIQQKDTVKQVVLPDTIQYINDSAFNSCYSLTKINFPASLKTIGKFVFTDCRALTTITISGSNFRFTNGALYQGTTLLYCPNKAITAPLSGTTAIADYAFYYNRNITSFTIPSTVTSIGEGAFGDCSSLTTVSFKTKKLTALPDYCFTYTKLTNVVIPDSVTAIGQRAFDVSGDKSQFLLVGKAGSIVQTYASDNGHQFLDVTKMVQNTAKVSMTYAVVGDTIKITAAAASGKAPYTYEACYKYQYDNGFSDNLLVNGATTASFTVNNVGAYTVRVAVTDGYGMKVEKSFNITVKDKIKPVSTLSAATVTLGESVTVTASATGGYGSYQYALQYKSSTDTAWQSAVALGTNAQMTTFKPTTYGKYSLRVTAKDAKNKAGYQYLTLTVNPQALQNNAKLSATTITLGKTVTVTGAATGGYGSYQYALQYKSPTDTAWQSAVALSSNTKMTFKPTTYGKYSLRVTVKDAKKKAAYKYFTLTVNPQTLQNNAKLSATTITLGNTVTVTGAATGGYGSYQYALEYKLGSATTWTSAVALSTNTNMTFKPTKAGSYSLRVTVKDAKNKAAYKYFTLTVDPKPLVNNSKLSATTITLGSSLTVTGYASGGTGSYRYALEYKGYGDTTWQTAVPLGTATKMIFKPTKKDTYSLRITVKDAKNKAAYKYANLVVK